MATKTPMTRHPAIAGDAMLSPDPGWQSAQRLEAERQCIEHHFEKR